MSMKQRFNPDRGASRRDALRLLGIGGVATMFGSSVSSVSSAQEAVAATQTAGQQGGGFYRFKVGELSLTLVSDGGFTVRPSDLFPKVGDDELAEATDKAFLSPGFLPTGVNTLLVQTPTALVLIDAGTAGAMGPTTGRLFENLAHAGVDASTITHVLITHAHPDHVGGITNEKLAHARVVIGAAEHAFWIGDDTMNGTLLPPEMQTGMREGARKALDAVKDRLDLVKPGDVVAGAITIVDAPGHTPGHLALSIKSGNDALLYISDLIVAAPLQAPHPEWHLLFDADPTRAAATRKQLLSRAAEARVLVAGSHLSFPALGHIAKDGDAFRWVPRLWEW